MTKPDLRDAPATAQDDSGSPDRPSRVSRRAFFTAAGVGAAGAALGVSTVANAQTHKWHEETDVIVVGSGGAALSAAVGAVQNGAKVIIFEKGPIPGGTTAKSGGAHWVPNNHYMQAKGLADPKEDAVRYMVRAAYPHLYRAKHPTMGISQLQYDLITAFYDEGPRVIKILADTGAMKTEQQIGATGLLPDYNGQVPENKKAVGRTLRPTNKDGGPGFGADMIRQLAAFAEAKGAPVRVEHAVTKLVIDGSRRVIGVEVDTPDGVRTVRARKGVVFGSGGFTHNVDMRNNYLRMPVMGGCAVPTAQGDFVNMAIEIGAKLGNMNEAWLQQEIVEEVVNFSSVPNGAFILGGDSMIVVNKLGQRVGDEKHVYNERTRSHTVWDATRAEYVNLYQFMLFDKHAVETGDAELMPPAGSDFPAYIITESTLEAMAVTIQKRLDALADKIGEFKLDPAFLANLRKTVERFNGYAETGVDLEFARGTMPIENAFHVRAKANDKPNMHMYPISKSGPYYCIILGPGVLDTKGGPVTNTKAQVLDVHDKPIVGLYAAGNCASSPAGQAYWGAGGTLGPGVTYGYIAGEQAAKQT